MALPFGLTRFKPFARTGNFFAYDTLGFGDYVDLVTVAKTVKNATTLYTDEYNPKPGLIAGTFAGSSCSMAAGVRILEMLDQEGYMGPTGKIQKIHDEFIGMLNSLNEGSCKGLLRDAGGLGLMVAVTPLDGSKEEMQEPIHKLFDHGVMGLWLREKDPSDPFSAARDPHLRRHCRGGKDHREIDSGVGLKFLEACRQLIGLESTPSHGNLEAAEMVGELEEAFGLRREFAARDARWARAGQCPASAENFAEPRPPRTSSSNPLGHSGARALLSLDKDADESLPGHNLF